MLGSILIKPEMMHYVKAETKLTPDSFYIPAHRIVFEAMEALHLAGRPTDMITVSSELRRMGHIERVGGDVFIAGLVEETPIADHLPFYVEPVEAKERLRCVLKASERLAYAAIAPDAQDGREIAAEGITALSEVVSKTVAEPSIAKEVDDLIVEWDDKAHARSTGVEVKMAGIATGYPRLDHYLNGLQPGLLILGGRPSCGKTTLEANIVGRAMQEDKLPVLRITRDSRCRDLVTRDVCRMAYVNLGKLNKGYMGKISRDRILAARENIAKWDQRIITTINRLPDTVAAIRADVKKRGTKLVTIDYLQLWELGVSDAKANQNRTMAVITVAFKALAYELGIPILCLSQLSRDKDRTLGKQGLVSWLDKRPILEDLRDSGSIEQDADMATLISKVCDLPDDEGFMGNVSLLGIEVAKQKNGATGISFFRFFRPEFTMVECTPNEQLALSKWVKDEKEGKSKDRIVEAPIFASAEDALKRANEMEVRA